MKISVKLPGEMVRAVDKAAREAEQTRTWVVERAIKLAMLADSKKEEKE